MPKLPKKTAQRVAEAEGGGDFEVLPEGRYVTKLLEVDASKPDGPAGPYWVWVLEVLEPEEHKSRRLWVNTSLAENADWKMKEVFTAFGYTPDTDTDEIVGEKCIAYVSQRVIEKGKRKGEMGNNVDRMAPYDEDSEEDDVF